MCIEINDWLKNDDSIFFCCCFPQCEWVNPTAANGVRNIWRVSCGRLGLDAFFSPQVDTHAHTHTHTHTHTLEGRSLGNKRSSTPGTIEKNPLKNGNGIQFDLILIGFQWVGRMGRILWQRLERILPGIWEDSWEGITWPTWQDLPA